VKRVLNMTRMKEATKDEFISFWLLVTLASSIGWVFNLPRVLAVLAGISATTVVGRGPSISPEDTVRQFIINLAVTAFFAFLTKVDFDREATRQRQAALASLPSLPVQLQDSLSLDTKSSPVQLIDVAPSRRIVLCIGEAAFCRACVGSAANLSRAKEGQADFLLIPIPLTSELEPDQVEFRNLAAGNSGSSSVALPDFGASAGKWAALSRAFLDRVREQGIADVEGLTILVGKQGEITANFLGAPEWDALAKIAT